MEKMFDPIKEIDHICNWIKEYFVENGPNSHAVLGISGGKDSTVAAMLLVKALGPDRVCGVMMPDFVQADIDDARMVCEKLNIRSWEIDIGPSVEALYKGLTECWIDNGFQKLPGGVTSNTPARIRMTTLYGVAGLVGGRVANTCNWSEDFVGYSTKYGDAAGDFGILCHYAVREVITMGCVLAKEFDIPVELIAKAPSDGMCGKTDEDNLGFTYDTLDSMLLDGIIPDYETFRNIMERHKRNTHKTNCIRLPAPRPLLYRKYQHWGQVEEERCFEF